MFEHVSISDIEIFNDCGDELLICKVKKYQYIGDIFGFDEIKSYNKHLDKYPYTNFDFINHPLWNKF